MMVCKCMRIGDNVLTFLRLPGLAGIGLGDFIQFSVDSWLAGVPFTRSKGETQLVLSASE